MDVVARRERVDEPGVVGQVGDDAKLDLVVVGDEEPAALGRDERPAEALALLGADGDVVRATVWLKVAWMRPSSPPSARRESP